MKRLIVLVLTLLMLNVFGGFAFAEEGIRMDVHRTHVHRDYRYHRHYRHRHYRHYRHRHHRHITGVKFRINLH